MTFTRGTQAVAVERLDDVALAGHRRRQERRDAHDVGIELARAQGEGFERHVHAEVVHLEAGG